MGCRTVRIASFLVWLGCAAGLAARGSEVGPAKAEVERHTYQVEADNCRAAIRACQVPEEIHASCHLPKTPVKRAPTLHIAGLTCSKLKQSYTIRLRTEQHGGGTYLCTASVNRISVVTRIRVYTPRWDMPKDVSDQARQVWDRWRKQIVDHENKHVAIYKREHARLVRELRTVGPVQERGETRKEAEQVAAAALQATLKDITHRIAEQAEAENRRLDRREGVITPPRCPG